MFQSTPLCKGRPSISNYQALGILFQSTPLCKGRHNENILLLPESCFNPRPYARGDALGLQWVKRMGVSIHAPMQGATIAVVDYLLHGVFQSTPLCKGRLNKGVI